jgi:hypothetical protein
MVMTTVDETNMSAEQAWYSEHQGKKAVKTLEANNFDAVFVPNRREALAKVIERIPPQATIGCGDSVTLHQVGFFTWAKQQKEHELIDPFTVMPYDYPNDWVKFRKERLKLQKRAALADVFVTSTNALTLDGKIVSIDGHGNRVAAMCFGPNRVIFVVGANKIVNNVDEAIKRIHEYVAPINIKRHLDKHAIPAFAELPCAITGSCTYCHHKNKGCRITVIIDGWSQITHTPGVELPPSIIVVGESLGI